jgi:hypothetical protein
MFKVNFGNKRVVIQDCQTKQFLRDGELWTNSLDEATPFSNSGQAALHCLRLKLNGVQVVLTFGAKKYDVVLPIHEHTRDGTPLPRAER